MLLPYLKDPEFAHVISAQQESACVQFPAVLSPEARTLLAEPWALSWERGAL